MQSVAWSQHSWKIQTFYTVSKVVRQKPWLEQLIPNPGMFVGGDF